MKSISAVSRDLKLCRKTVRERIRQGWNFDKIKNFYSSHKRLRTRNNKKKAETIISQIEAATGEQFQITIRKIINWSTNKKEIADALEISVAELDSCLNVLDTKDILKLTER